MTRADIERAKQQILDARSGHEWAFYNGTAHRDCPEVVRRVAALQALVSIATRRV